jgi:preprotein translocase subunit SecE
METKVEDQPTFVDTAKLVLAGGIVLIGFVAYYYFGDASVLLRALAVLAAAGIAAFVAFQSAQGQALWRFIQASRVELRKVVWPTIEETRNTTIAVLVFALIMGTFFWLLDIFLLYLTSKVTGQGGL